MFWKKYKWHKAANSEAEIILNRNGIGVVELEGKKICVAKYDNEWRAFAYSCPHAGGIMAEGYLDGAGNVSCPIHGYKFNMTNGRCKIPEGFKIKTFKVETREDGFYIGVEEGRFFK
ncbi:MAG TPA: Rieske 2Fe-2S domain-containing protein [Puia sp.]|nr:Rieske 2Fe-2S domain-containing protein [Puia sp.]